MQPGRSVALDDVQQLLEIEARHVDDRGALGQAQVEHHRLAVDVEVGQEPDQDVVLRDRHRAPGLLDVRHQVPMGEHHPLHHSRGPARVGQDGEVFGIHLDLLRLRAEHRLADQTLGVVDHQPSAGVLDLPRDLLLHEQRVHRRHDRPRPEDRVVGDPPLGAVRPDEPDDRPLDDPPRLKQRRDGVDLCGEIPVGGDLAAGAVDERRMVAARRRPADHVLGQRDVRDLDVGFRAAVDHDLSSPGPKVSSPALHNPGYSRRPRASAAIPPNIAISRTVPSATGGTRGSRPWPDPMDRVGYRRPTGWTDSFAGSSKFSITRLPRPRVKKLKDHRISTTSRFWKPIR